MAVSLLRKSGEVRLFRDKDIGGLTIHDWDAQREEQVKMYTPGKLASCGSVEQDKVVRAYLVRSCSSRLLPMILPTLAV